MAKKVCACSKYQTFKVPAGRAKLSSERPIEGVRELKAAVRLVQKRAVEAGGFGIGIEAAREIGE